MVNKMVEKRSTIAREFFSDGSVCPITIMSEPKANDYWRQPEEVEKRYRACNEFLQGLRRYSDLLLPFVDEITRKAEITDVIA